MLDGAFKTTEKLSYYKKQRKNINKEFSEALLSRLNRKWNSKWSYMLKLVFTLKDSVLRRYW